MADDPIAQFDSFIRRDPAQRGLIGSEARFGPLCPGHLQAAAAHLAQHAQRVAIVTGFFIPRGEPPAAETDGPPGALLLAQTLRLAGMDVVVVTDGYCATAVAAAARAVGFPGERLLRYPHPSAAPPLTVDTDQVLWRERLFSTGGPLSHLIAIERVGPSHTLVSLESQSRQGQAPVERFETAVALSQRDHCHNMRGDVIDEYAGDVHRLFEDAAQFHPDVTTIGIGDGGNEIGMGAIPWEDLERRLAGEQAGRVPCRIPCDWNIVAGTSNWGAAALAASVLWLRGQTELLQPFTAEAELRVLEAMVADGPAVDGVTRRREPTVDGIPFLTYIQPWEGMRRALGLNNAPR